MSLKNDKKPLANDATLASVGISDGAELTVKDLGPQVSWTTVFLVEYVRIYILRVHSVRSCASPTQGGPLLIHPLFYHLPRVLYGTSVQHSSLQK
jgi:very-long-chain enoyl-CoA reductase